jgi:hypothetical protein
MIEFQLEQPMQSRKSSAAKQFGTIAAAAVLLSSLLIMTQNPTSAYAVRNRDVGVLVYTHGDMMNHHGTPSMDKMMGIDERLEDKFSSPSEIVFHMPYNWDEGLVNLDTNNDVDYAIFLYTDMFGPMSTVIHNVTRGVFGGIEEYNHCPGVPMGGDACMYMGMVTEPASAASDTVLVFAEPARPDHPILRKIFFEQAKAVSEKPRDEILVLVGHGARSDTNDMNQVAELARAAKYVENRMNFADSTAVTAREDWPDLQPAAIEKAVNEIKDMLEDTGADTVVLVPATGSGSGFHMIEEALDAEGIEYIVAPEDLPIGEKYFLRWAAKTVRETLAFIKEEKPTENTITPYWDRNYKVD